MRLGLEIFRNFAWDPFMRAVGGIMVCRGWAGDEGEGRVAWIEGMKMVCEEALSDSETPEEEDRMWWAGWVINERERFERERVERERRDGTGGGNRGGGTASDTEMGGMEGGDATAGAGGGVGVNCARNGNVSARVMLSLDDAYAVAEMKVFNRLREGFVNGGS